MSVEGTLNTEASRARQTNHQTNVSSNYCLKFPKTGNRFYILNYAHIKVCLVSFCLFITVDDKVQCVVRLSSEFKRILKKNVSKFEIQTLASIHSGQPHTCSIAFRSVHPRLCLLEVPVKYWLLTTRFLPHSSDYLPAALICHISGNLLTIVIPFIFS